MRAPSLSTIDLQLCRLATVWLGCLRDEFASMCPPLASSSSALSSLFPLSSFPALLSPPFLLFRYPLSILKDMSSLAFTSSASCAADIILVMIIVGNTPASSTIAAAGGLGAVVSSSVVRPATLFSGLGAISFAFICHHSSFLVANSLSNPTKERWALVTHLSVGTAGVLCVILGVSGYLGFLDDTTGNVLNNFDNSPSMTAARVMLGLTMFFTYPMESFVARHAIAALRWGEEAGHDLSDRRR